MSLLRQTTRRINPNPHSFLLSTSIIRPSPTSTPCSGRRHFSFAGTITATTDALSWAHVELGMPWYVVIPLLAVGVNTTIRFPIQYYVARLREKRKELSPLVQGWSRRHSTTLNKELGPDVPERIMKLRIAGATQKSQSRIYKNWGVQRWKGFAPLLSMFPFLTISEALRRKCGAPVGWISQSAGLDNAATTSMIDPSLTHGGLFWFTDLTAMDPYFGLPLVCSGILIWNTWGKMSKNHLMAIFSMKTADPSEAILLTRIQKVMGRVMLMVPVMPLLFADLPSAIFLYWASSFALTGINEAVLSRVVPKAPSNRLTVVSKTEPPTGFLKGSGQPTPTQGQMK